MSEALAVSALAKRTGVPASDSAHPLFKLFFETASGRTLAMLISRWSRPA